MVNSIAMWVAAIIVAIFCLSVLGVISGLAFNSFKNDLCNGWDEGFVGRLIIVLAAILFVCIIIGIITQTTG